MNNQILAELERTCPHAIQGWFDQAVTIIDGKLGDGFAKAHPELIGQLVQATAQNFNAHMLEIASRSKQES